jgi:hypothetical protein
MRQIAPNLYPFAQTCSVRRAMLGDMNEQEEAHSAPDIMSHHQIIERFKKLFGRDMTPKERDIFFLPDEAPSAEGKQ